MTTCSNCGIELTDDDVYVVKGKPYCDDCAISQQKISKTCDPSAVHSALLDRKKSGFKGTEGLTKRQITIYNYIKKQHGATLSQMVDVFHYLPEDLESDLTVLRHLELGKGQKRKDGIYFVLWKS